MSQENLQHQAEALANLATAITSDRQAFDVLTNTNLQLNQTITELLKKTEALEAKINSMQKLNGRATKPPRNLLIQMDTAPHMDSRLRTATTAKHVRPQEKTIM
jgi:hypothetical protein